MNEETVKILINALVELAAFTDDYANARLINTGEYRLFDEPGTVQVAREALNKAKLFHINGERYEQ